MSRVHAIRGAIPSISRRTIPVPAGFGWPTAPITSYYSRRNVETDFDVSKFQPVGAGKTYYVDITKSDSNDGLTAGTAFKSLTKALTMEDYDIIIIAPGLYNRLYSGYGANVTRSCTIKASSTAPILSSHDVPSWTKSGGYTNVYQITRSSVTRVFDASILTAYGDYTELPLLASVEAVDAAPGSFYTDNVTTWVHTPDSRAADASIYPFMGGTLFGNSGDVDIYVENLKFYGGSYCVRIRNAAGPTTPNFYAKNCEFAYSGTSNGLTVEGAETVYLQGCVAKKNKLDGFNYHASNAVIPKVIEVACIGRDNDDPGSASNNGSSIHDGGKIIRVGGEHCRNHGPNLMNATADTHAWNLNCYAHDAGVGSDFSCNDDDLTWLDTCRGGSLTVASGKTVYTHNCVIAAITGSPTPY